MICRRQSMAVVAFNLVRAHGLGGGGIRCGEDARNAKALLQFTAGGHVLGFDQGRHAWLHATTC